MRKTLDEYMAMPYRMEIVEDKETGRFDSAEIDGTKKFAQRFLRIQRAGGRIRLRHENALSDKG